MSTQYYQVGGYRGQIASSRSQYDDKDLAKALIGPSSPLRQHHNLEGPIEMILGIKNTGSSHLLVTVDQALELTTQRTVKLSNNGCLSCWRFESLSPIYFHTVDELNKKLSQMRPKATKKTAWADNVEDRDTSQANHIYKSSNIDTERAAFEHGRLIYRILGSTVDAVKYGVDNSAWTQNLRVCSFVFNVRPIDDRKREEKLRNPVVLDVGFCEAVLPSLEPDNSTARHLIDQRNSLLGGNRKPFVHGKSEKILNQVAMQQPVQECFKDHRVRSSSTMILLVWNKQLTLNYLHNLNVDTSAWSYDLKALLSSSSSNLSGHRHRAQSSYNHSRTHHGPSYEDQYCSRSRSGSPRPRDPRMFYNPSTNPSNSSSRSGSPRPRDPRLFRNPSTNQSNGGERYDSPRDGGQNRDSSLYPPVCLVDVQQLYFKLMSSDQVNSIGSIARQFGITNADGICAGNEASFIIKIWKDMIAHELAIDEQRTSRYEASFYNDQLDSAGDAGPSSAPAFAPLDSDDEQDPNDIPAQPTANTVNKTQHMSFEDGESDYGEDSDDDSD